MVMKRNSAWRKNNRREIKHTLERYLAILAIVALGTGFFSGLKITKSAMVNSMNSYVAEQKMYDYRLLSTLGLTKEDVVSLSRLDDITVEGTISMDFIADIDHTGNNEVVLKAHSITDSINKLKLRYGRMPETGNECVLDNRRFSEDIIGSTIKVATSNNDKTLDAFAYDEYTVVGIVDSVNYLNYDRGTTNLSGGSIYAYVYIPVDGFKTDYFTELLTRLKGNSQVYSEEYEALISDNKEPLEEALKTRAKLRHQEIVKEAQDKVSEAQLKYDDAREEYLSKKAEAEAELDKALADLNAAGQEINENEAKLKDGESKITDAEKEYDKSLIDYEKGLKKLEKEKSEALALLDSKQEQISAGRTAVISGMSKIEESGVIDQHTKLTQSIQSMETAIANITNQDSEDYKSIQSQLNQAREAITAIEATGVIQQYAQLKSSLAQLDAGQKDIDKGRTEANSQFAAVEDQLKAAKSQLASGKQQIDKNKLDISTGWNALNDGKAEYEKGFTEYEDAKAKADEEFSKAEEELSEAESKINDARKKVEDIPEAKVYVLDRSTNMGYANFENDSSIVDGIAKLLPIYFFLVAALVCLTTMTRMVDEQRTQIGTLKALGYSDGSIIRKYIFYSGSSALLGCVLGYLLGTKFFPIAIWKAYGMLYELSSIEYIFDIKLAVFTLIVSMLCSVGVTYISCKAELLQMPAQLIRPRAPKAGKRVLLERIPYIWNRISFLHKVSIRNILRYKRRLIMTVLGIAGCTSLVVAAMGISDSIRNIANDQFDTIMTYDYNISFSEAQNSAERENFIQSHNEALTECVFVSTNEMEVVHGSHIKKVTIVATDDPDITKVIGLHLKDKNISYPTFGKVVINDKLAEELDISLGDTITIKINETETADAQVSSMFENYISNYMFMTGETYKELFGEEPLYKNVYATTDEVDLYPIAASLSDADNVAIVSVLNDMRVMVENMMKSLDSIIWLVIACAGALGFVVIYNLNNINITERSREIATIKVLGFYSGETRSYVFRETIILTIIGSLLGLVLGKLLHSFIMDQINVEMVTFKEQIFTVSYLVAIIVTFVITFLVNLMLNKKLEKINMTESLKSVE